MFLDTSLIVPATVEAHPSHESASTFVDIAVSRGETMYISAQICREFMVVLTRQPVSNRVFSLEEALAALEVWMTGCVVLEENHAVLGECLSLVRGYGVHGKQIHDCNIVATMRVHGVQGPATRNAGDFKRFGEIISVTPVVD